MPGMPISIKKVVNPHMPTTEIVNRLRSIPDPPLTQAQGDRFVAFLNKIEKTPDKPRNFNQGPLGLLADMIEHTKNELTRIKNKEKSALDRYKQGKKDLKKSGADDYKQKKEVLKLDSYQEKPTQQDLDNQKLLKRLKIKLKYAAASIIRKSEKRPNADFDELITAAETGDKRRKTGENIANVTNGSLAGVAAVPFLWPALPIIKGKPINNINKLIQRIIF